MLERIVSIILKVRQISAQVRLRTQGKFSDSIAVGSVEYRLLESGDLRLLEDGSLRLLE